ncbi:hypothetical protein K439DRAFT_201505 [Ramaria rubella]|nr:hypothetical protein K439DRAFT_201505 [Ramaria rubella]
MSRRGKGSLSLLWKRTGVVCWRQCASVVAHCAALSVGVGAVDARRDGSLSLWKQRRGCVHQHRCMSVPVQHVAPSVPVGDVEARGVHHNRCESTGVMRVRLRWCTLLEAHALGGAGIVVRSLLEAETVSAATLACLSFNISQHSSNPGLRRGHRSYTTSSHLVLSERWIACQSKLCGCGSLGMGC